MQIEIATLFPEMCEAVLSESIIGRARKAGHISVRCWNIRDYTLDKHRRVDDVPYGGGRGMVMQADPIYRCYEAVCRDIGTKPYVIYMSPKGKVLEQQRSLELSVMPHIFVLCGHYEGVDQRILDEIVDEEVSIGDYVLTGGELPALVLVQGVVFAFASIELVGTAAGECKDPQTMVPKAINSVIWRIGLFYVGSVVLLVLLLPWNAYQAGQSPFVTFFSKLGVPYVGSIMNIVVLTAALSSLNSGLYSTGRILRSMSMGGSAPKFMSKMSRQQVPYAGILATLVVYIFGVFLNYLVPSRVFEIVLNVAALGIIASWAFIVVCQMRLRKAIKEGKAAKVSFRMPGAPFTSWLTLLFLFSVLVLMAFDYPNGTYTIGSIPLLAVLLVAGWFGVRKRVHEIHSTAPTLRK